VFVIGAGAHAEYRMPTGAELKSSIASAVNFGTNGSDPELHNLLSDRFKGASSRYEAAGPELAKVIPSFPSIDEALHWFTSRRDIIEVGKLAIVQQILAAERRSPLATQHSDESGWLPHFLSMVMSSLQMEQASSAFRNITVINFNYDRVIEHFLYFALQEKYGLSAEIARDVISGLNMIRPYGSVGQLEWQQQDKPRVPFGYDLGRDHERLFSISTGIYTFTEQIDQAEIQPVMDKARMVVFLGFGFHQQNLNLLRVTGGQPWRRAYATALGMQEENKPTMKAAISSVVGCDAPDMPVLLDWRAHVLVDRLRPALMAAASM
jgi:hypothetical protein